MSLRHETRRVQVAYQRIDARGRLYCHDCTPEAERAELEFATSPQTEQPCEGCGRLVGSVTVETTACVAVEYVTCRIF